MIWNAAMERLPRSDLEALQGERLAQVVERVCDRVPLYKDQLDSAGAMPDRIKGLGDLARLTFTRKANLHNHYPFGLFAAPLSEIYGLSEIIGQGDANECIEAKNGSHVFEDHFIVEVIDPKTEACR